MTDEEEDEEVRKIVTEVMAESLDPTHEIKNAIKVPTLCDSCQYKIVVAGRYKESDPWRALLIVVNLALFQGAASTASVWKKLDGDINKIETLGCLGCRLPHKFNELLRALKKNNDLSTIKELGNQWVFDSNIQHQKEGQDGEQQTDGTTT